MSWCPDWSSRRSTKRRSSAERTGKPSTHRCIRRLEPRVLPDSYLLEELVLSDELPVAAFRSRKPTTTSWISWQEDQPTKSTRTSAFFHLAYWAAQARDLDKFIRVSLIITSNPRSITILDGHSNRDDFTTPLPRLQICRFQPTSLHERLRHPFVCKDMSLILSLSHVC